MAPSSGFVIYRLINNGIQTGVRWYLRVVCMSISLLMSDDDFFPGACCPLYISFREMSIQDFCPFSKIVLSCFALGGQASNIEPTA